MFTANETPFANVVVTLRSAAGAVVQTTTTDMAGNYVFNTDLLSNTTYVVTLQLGDLPGFEPTPGKSEPTENCTFNARFFLCSGSPLVYDRNTDTVSFTHTTGAYGSEDLDVDFPFVAQFDVCFTRRNLFHVFFCF